MKFRAVSVKCDVFRIVATVRLVFVGMYKLQGALLAREVRMGMRGCEVITESYQFLRI
jgi:hypothetical protein